MKLWQIDTELTLLFMFDRKVRDYFWDLVKFFWTKKEKYLLLTY